MKNFLLLFLFGILLITPNFVLAETFHLNLYKKENGQLILNEKSDRPVQVLDVNYTEELTINGNYEATIVSFNEAILEKIFFDPMIVVTFDKVNYETERLTGGMEEFSSGPFSLILPYFSNAQYILIKHNETNTNLKIYVSGFARCNENKICEQGEDEKDCPSDCQAKPPLTFFGKFWRWLFTILYWLAILGLIILIVIAIIKKKKSRKTSAKL